MHISQINQQIIKQTTDHKLSFKPGQIIKGKIMKIFPEQHAEILLGNQRIIAKLEAALQVGKSYFFQVQNNEKVHHLKVIQEVSNEAEKQVEQLLEQLDLKGNKAQKQFVRQLLNQNIPFQPNDLQQAFSFLTKGLQVKLTNDLLTEMFHKKMPITEQVFTALYQKATGNITAAIENLQGILNDQTALSSGERQLLTLMNNLTQNSYQVKEQPEISIRNQAPSITNLLYHLGIINENEQRLINRQPTLNHLAEVVEKSGISPLYRGNIEGFLSQIIENSEALLLASKENIKLLKHLLMDVRTVEEPLNPNVHQGLIKNIQNEILTNLPSIENESIIKFTANNPPSIERMIHLLAILENPETYLRLKEYVKLKQQFDFDLIKSNFQEQLKHYFQITGLTNEGNEPNQTINIKQLLTQFLSSENTGINQRAQVLLQMMQGIQLTTVNETENFIHVRIELPGSIFNVPKNMELEFSGRKTENGGLNPDYCRIVFFLELEQLSNIVIDMNVQKRIITLTIYNNHEQIEKLGKKFEGILQTKLAEMDYQISSIRYQKFKIAEKSEEEFLYGKAKLPQKGVDFKI